MRRKKKKETSDLKQVGKYQKQVKRDKFAVKRDNYIYSPLHKWVLKLTGAAKPTTPIPHPHPLTPTSTR